MRAIWELVETIITPIITYGSESWEPKINEMAQIEAIFNKAIKTILQLPDQTPTAILLAETGFLPIEMIVKRKKIMHANRVALQQGCCSLAQDPACVTLWRQLQTRFWDASPRASVQNQQPMVFSFFHLVLTNYRWFFLHDSMNE